MFYFARPPLCNDNKQDTHQGLSLAQEAAIAAVSLVNQGIASRGTFHHRVQLRDGSLRTAAALKSLFTLAAARMLDHVAGRCIAGEEEIAES